MKFCERSEQATENKKMGLGGNFKLSGCGRATHGQAGLSYVENRRCKWQNTQEAAKAYGVLKVGKAEI